MLPYCYLALLWHGNIFSILCLESFSMCLYLSAYKCYMEYVSTLMTFHPYLKAKRLPYTWGALFIIKESWWRQLHNPRRNTEAAVFIWALFCWVSKSHLEESQTEWTMLMWPYVNPTPGNPFSVHLSWWKWKEMLRINFCMQITGTNKEKTFNLSYLLIIFSLTAILQRWYH